jgi:hypothetical protein
MASRTPFAPMVQNWSLWLSCKAFPKRPGTDKPALSGNYILPSFLHEPGEVNGYVR